MCSIVATAVHAPSHSARSPDFPAGSKQPEVLWRDDNFTIYRERANPVSSKGHLLVVFKYVHLCIHAHCLETIAHLQMRLVSMYLQYTCWYAIDSANSQNYIH